MVFGSRPFGLERFKDDRKFRHGPGHDQPDYVSQFVPVYARLVSDAFPRQRPAGPDFITRFGSKNIQVGIAEVFSEPGAVFHHGYWRDALSRWPYFFQFSYLAQIRVTTPGLRRVVLGDAAGLDRAFCAAPFAAFALSNNNHGFFLFLGSPCCWSAMRSLAAPF